jgi:hypothetical protein
MGVQGPERYCWNCGFWGRLADDWCCVWCRAFFYRHRRMPRPGEQM